MLSCLVSCINSCIFDAKKFASVKKNEYLCNLIMDSINRHIKVLELVRKECGELNYCGQLERIETLFNLEPDETNKYLLKYEIERLRLLIEKQKSKQAEGTEAYSP